MLCDGILECRQACPLHRQESRSSITSCEMGFQGLEHWTSTFATYGFGSGEQCTTVVLRVTSKDLH